MERDWLTIGRVLSPWGLKGDVKVEITTDYPQQRFTAGKLVYIDGVAMTVESSRLHKDNVILKLDTVADIDHASLLKGKFLKIPQSEQLPLEQDRYYYHQLIGLNVTTKEGRFLGKIVKILPTGSNDVYVVDGDGGEILIPAIADVVKRVDLEKGYLLIEQIDGLI